MIRVQPVSEPPTFDAAVRQKGLAWLEKNGHPTRGLVPPGVVLRPYWRACIPELRASYDSVCAYVSLWVPAITGGATVEHFVPKSRAIEDAYEWVNYRFACAKINSRKRDFTDVLDPFAVENGWFTLEFLGMSVGPASGLSEVDRARVVHTIDRLGLDDAECRAARSEYWSEYVGGHIDKSFLERRCPFVHREAKRQGLL